MSFCEQQRCEEISALKAIYADELNVEQDEAAIVRISIDRGCGVMLCTFNLPATYPGSALPVLDLTGAVSAEEAAAAEQELFATFQPGEPVLFDCIQALRERFAAAGPCHEERQYDAAKKILLPGAIQAAQLEQPQVSKREEDVRQQQHTPPDQELEAVAARIVSGEPVTEKRSTFQAHLCTEVRSVHEVDLVRRALLQKHAKIRNATHNILAYRIFDERMHSYMQSCDDDGETAAGGRLLFLLETMGATDVVVIVSRWFGGILLGGQRFKVINHAAQRLLQEHGIDQRHNRQLQGASKPTGSRAQRRT